MFFSHKFPVIEQVIISCRYCRFALKVRLCPVVDWAVSSSRSWGVVDSLRNLAKPQAWPGFQLWSGAFVGKLRELWALRKNEGLLRKNRVCQVLLVRQVCLTESVEVYACCVIPRCHAKVIYIFFNHLQAHFWGWWYGSQGMEIHYIAHVVCSTDTSNKKR